MVLISNQSYHSIFCFSFAWKPDGLYKDPARNAWANGISERQTTGMSLGISRNIERLSGNYSISLSENLRYRVVVPVHHSFFQRDDAVIGNLDMFRANNRTAFVDVAIA